MGRYNDKTVFDEFRHGYSYKKGGNDEFVSFLNSFYDKVKALPIEKVKDLLPINHHGYNGSYHEPWMIRYASSNKNYPFTINGQIYDWYGDRTTCDIITAAANTMEDVYRRMLIQYMYHLKCYIEYTEAEKEFNHIVISLYKGQKG